MLHVNQLVGFGAGGQDLLPFDTGWVIAGAGATVDTGAGTAWTSPGNITASDNTGADNTGSTSQSDSLKASSFGLSVPSGATIVGIETRAELIQSGSGTKTYSYVDIGKDDSTLATSKNPGDTITTSDVLYDDGGAADLWGLSWTPTEVNASTFQVRIRTTSGSALGHASCDAIWVKVHYLA